MRHADAPAPFRLGLTGSIGMGKTTTAAMFAAAGAATWDADDAVRRLYAAGGAGAHALARVNGAVVGADGVDRVALKAWIARDDEALARIEAVIHPLVRDDRAQFIAAAQAPIVVCDIPLLYETGADGEFDAVSVVTAPAAVQRDRVLSRDGMDAAQLDRILARQMPDAEKRARADYVIETTSMDAAREQVLDVVEDIRRRQSEEAGRA